MKIAILSDIHGNDTALKAVLNEARSLNVQRLLVLGDLVGYYYNPDRVLALLSQWPKELIRGNHEEILSRASCDENYLHKIEMKYGKGIKYALENLSAEQIAMLISLPNSSRVVVDGLRLELHHGSPRHSNEYVYPDASLEVLQECASLNTDFVLMGHTHYPFMFTKDGVTIVNPGSVGQARDKGGMASWAVLNTANRSIVFKHTPFDVEVLKDQAMRIDPECPYLWEVLER